MIPHNDEEIGSHCTMRLSSCKRALLLIYFPIVIIVIIVLIVIIIIYYYTQKNTHTFAGFMRRGRFGQDGFEGRHYCSLARLSRVVTSTRSLLPTQYPLLLFLPPSHPPPPWRNCRAAPVWNGSHFLGATCLVLLPRRTSSLVAHFHSGLRMTGQ